MYKMSICRRTHRAFRHDLHFSTILIKKFSSQAAECCDATSKFLYILRPVSRTNCKREFRHLLSKIGCLLNLSFRDSHWDTGKANISAHMCTLYKYYINKSLWIRQFRRNKTTTTARTTRHCSLDFIYTIPTKQRQKKKQIFLFFFLIK